MFSYVIGVNTGRDIPSEVDQVMNALYNGMLHIMRITIAPITKVVGHTLFQIKKINALSYSMINYQTLRNMPVK